MDHKTARARNKKIVAEHLSTGEIVPIAEEWGITPERVRQILRAAGVTVAQSRRARRRLVPCRCCGELFETYPSEAERGRAFINREHYERWRSRTAGTSTPSSKMGPDGHYWVTDPASGRRMRYERYIAQRKLGRSLERTERVTLRDGDPANLDEANILIRQGDRLVALAEF